MAVSPLRQVAGASGYCDASLEGEHLSVATLRRELESFTTRIQDCVHREIQNLPAPTQSASNLHASPDRPIRNRNKLDFADFHRADIEEYDDHEWMARPWYSHFYSGPAKGMLPEELTKIGTPKPQDGTKHSQLFHRPRGPSTEGSPMNDSTLKRKQHSRRSGVGEGRSLGPDTPSSAQNSSLNSSDHHLGITDDEADDENHAFTPPPAPRRGKQREAPDLKLVSELWLLDGATSDLGENSVEHTTLTPITTQVATANVEAQQKHRPPSPMLLEDVGERVADSSAKLEEGVSFVREDGGELSTTASGPSTVKLLAQEERPGSQGKLRPPSVLEVDQASAGDKSPVFSSYIRKSMTLSVQSLPQRTISQNSRNSQSSQRSQRLSTLGIELGSVDEEPAPLKPAKAKSMKLRDRFHQGARHDVALRLSLDGEQELENDDQQEDGSPSKTKECCGPLRKSLPSSLLDLEQGEGFDWFIAALVFLNAALVGVRADYAISHFQDDKKEPLSFHIIELVFCVMFVLELILRLRVHGREFFTEPSWCWNVLDLIVVSCQVISEVLEWRESKWTVNVSWSYVRIIRVLRIVRIVRLARLVHVVRELRTMVASVSATLKSLCWTIALICLMIYMIGVLIIQVIVEHAREDRSILVHGTPLAMFYGSLGRTVLSLYQAFTGGLDWDNLVTPLIDHTSPLFAVFFSLYIAFAVLAMMNVITGLFVESALKNTKVEEDIDMVNSMRELFKSIDFAHTNQITWDQFRRQLLNPRMDAYFKAIDLDVSEAKGLFKLLDLDESGSISVDEFVLGCLRLRGPAKAIDLATLMYDSRRANQRWFRIMDALQHNMEYLIESCMDSGPSPRGSWAQDRPMTGLSLR